MNGTLVEAKADFVGAVNGYMKFVSTHTLIYQTEDGMYMSIACY